MATQSPFPFLDGLFRQLSNGLKPPPWLVDEMQRRLVLMLNHVLMQEPQAQARLVRQAGRATSAMPDLTLTLTEESPWQLAQAAARGDKPPVRIAGDVQFAAEINWLVDHVRWDLEEDLSRLMGDAPAHAIGQGLHRMAEALRRFVPAAAQAPAPAPTPSAGPAPAASPVPPGPPPAPGPTGA
jgi:ubiquinone biosynthesis protein UbiJ